MSNQCVLYKENEGFIEEIPLPTKWVICSGCDGHGKSSAYLGAYTSEELHEAGEEFIEDYFAGHYDRRCEECNGRGSVQIVDRKALSPEDLALWEQQERDEAELNAIEAAERRMGA